MKRTKAIVLMSGGLDSILAAKTLSELGVDVTPICFESYFFSCAAARRATDELGLTLRVVDFSKEQLAIVKYPRYGHGGAVNPCIDCHLLMLKTAKAIMDAEGFDLVATGEVLGERPMSQNKLSLDIIERESGLAGILLRPLSAKLLPPTVSETNGLIDRSKLYDISGRSRKPQMDLAKRFGIKNIPQPGGGCILTETEYGQKLKKLFTICSDFDGSDVQVLSHCRPIWEKKLLLAVARNESDCKMLKKLAKTGDFIMEPLNFPGPVVLARDFESGSAEDRIVPLGKKYILQYSKKIPAAPEISVYKI